MIDGIAESPRSDEHNGMLKLFVGVIGGHKLQFLSLFGNDKFCLMSSFPISYHYETFLAKSCVPSNIRRYDVCGHIHEIHGLIYC